MERIEFLGHEYYLKHTSKGYVLSRKGHNAKTLVYSLLAELQNKGYDLSTINTSWLMGHATRKILNTNSIKGQLGIQLTTIERYFRQYKQHVKSST